MKRAPHSKTARELASITSSFLQVRVLHYASAAPATAADLIARLRPHAAAANPARILARMTRSGLLSVEAPPANQPQFARQYSLTPKGRRLLDTAKKHLRHLPPPKTARS